MELSKYDNVVINSNEYALPHILNVSVMGIKPETMLHALEEYGIYISTQSACSSGNTVSRSVLEVSKSEKIASHSIRISLSGLTTDLEVDQFLASFYECYKRLSLK